MNYGIVIKVLDFSELTDDEKEYQPNNGSGKEYSNYLRMVYKGESIRLESDAMEPEDARFTRDLSWIPIALLKAYELGRDDGKFAVNA